MTAPCRGVGEWGGGCGRWPGRLFCFFLEKTKNVEGAGVARWGRVRLLVVGVSIGWRTVLFFVVFFFIFCVVAQVSSSVLHIGQLS